MAQHSVELPPPYKREPGMTKVFAAPLRLRISGVLVDPELEARAPVLLGRALERYAERIARVALRFAQIERPRGAADVACRIEVFLNDRDPVVVEGRAHDAANAFRKASTLARSELEKKPRAKRAPKARTARR